MMLLLDIGNTSVKWAVRENGAMSPGGCFQHQGEDFKALAQAGTDPATDSRRRALMWQLVDIYLF